MQSSQVVGGSSPGSTSTSSRPHSIQRGRSRSASSSASALSELEVFFLAGLRGDAVCRSSRAEAGGRGPRSRGSPSPPCGLRLGPRTATSGVGCGSECSLPSKRSTPSSRRLAEISRACATRMIVVSRGSRPACSRWPISVRCRPARLPSVSIEMPASRRMRLSSLPKRTTCSLRSTVSTPALRIATIEAALALHFFFFSANPYLRGLGWTSRTCCPSMRARQFATAPAERAIPLAIALGLWGASCVCWRM